MTRSTPVRPSWWRAFWPAPMPVDARERLRVVVGAFIGIGLTGLLCHLSGLAASLPQATPWLVAPMGASAVLVFGVPNSPLAQPWSVVGGNTISALVGIACAHWIAPVELAAALAVGLAIGAMFALRCLHPPGGASALLVVLSGVTDPRFALFPVLLNSVLLVIAGIAWNNATKRRYPHSQGVPAAAAASPGERTLSDDIDAVLARYNQVLDISRDDLMALLGQTQLRAYQRKLDDTRCSDVMSRDLATVEWGTPLEDAWALLRERRIKALPVVDRTGRIVGIVTLADFMRTAELDFHDGFDQKLKQLIRKSGITHTTKPEVVGQIMTRQVRVASEHRRLAELVPLFGSTGHHHLPIVGADQKLVGMITQSDLVAALTRTETG